MTDHPQSPNLLEKFTTAVKYFQSGKIAGAEKLCLQINSADPTKPDPLNLLAIIKAQAGEVFQADHYFNQALSLAPNRPDFQGNYAKFLLEQWRLEPSIEHAKTSLDINPEQAEVHYLLGQAYLLQNKAHSAIPCFQNTVRIDSKHFNAYVNLGNAYKKLEQIQEARSHFASALQINPQSDSVKKALLEVDEVWLHPLEGKNLILRPHQVTDVDYLESCFNNRDFMDRYNLFIPRNQTCSELTEQVNKNSQKHPCQSRRMDWIILKKETQKPIGLAALADIQFQHQRAEFLVGIPEANQRHGGAALEASLLVMDFAFNKVNLNKLTTGVYGTNPQAQRNTLALGFTQESYLAEHLYLHYKNSYVDLYGNGLLRKNYQDNARLAKLSKRLLG